MPRTELLLGIPNLLAGDSLDHMHFQNKNTAPDTPGQIGQRNFIAV